MSAYNGYEICAFAAKYSKVTHFTADTQMLCDGSSVTFVTPLTMAFSPTSNTKAHVISVFDDKPSYSCAKCSAVIVRLFRSRCCLCLSRALLKQALQDELISKSFSGRDGRGLFVKLPWFRVRH